MRQQNHNPVDGLDDVGLSHAFITSLHASYGGMWAFERSLRALEPAADREDELSRAEQVLMRLQGWHRRVDHGSSLFRQGDRPVLDDDSSRAWRLLHVAEGRLRSLIEELMSSSDIAVLRDDDFARHVRVAAMVECARADELHVRGMVDCMTAMGDEQGAESWRQRLLACTVQVEEADRWLAAFREQRGEPSLDLLEQFLDDTLLLAAQVAERVVEICHTFSLYTGVFDFADVGIDAEDIQTWLDSGFGPHDAGRWFAAGHSPATAAEWMAVGAADPMLAAGFMWRGFTPVEAAPWLSRHISGRRAAVWAGCGHDAEDAREWIALGLPEPHILASVPALESRLM
ncbi:MAG: hypothetical protein GKS06_05555 [Acidobacteria bacterium]|nr:hypothetical protein [Acidobacteriota bacterium]